MSEIGLRPKMLVKDVMTSPVITVREDEPVSKVAQLMDQQNIGCVIVTSRDGKPLGIITERDLVIRVLAKKAESDELLAKNVMTSPLITVNPDETLSNVARTMSRLNIRRLVVMYRGNMVGIISSKDILAVMPELIEIMHEKTRIEGRTMDELSENPPLAGYCDRCGRWSDALQEYEGQFLCSECRLELKKEY